MDRAVLNIEHLFVRFGQPGSEIEAVSDVTLSVQPGEILGVVGESGSGKSTLCLSVFQLLQGTSARITGGSIHLGEQDLLHAAPEELRQVRGGEAGMVFQEPMTSLNPVLSVGRHLDAVLRLHNPAMTKADRYARAVELLGMVGIPAPEKRLREYPHQLSGGMRQRVMIAMALANRPQLLLCDEPTTALDVTIQAQVLQLIRRLSRENGSAVLFITHAMGVIAQIADRVAVMYSGQVVECGDVKDIFRAPLHPYTQGLLASIPRLENGPPRLTCIPGTVARRAPGQTGCAFAPRCPYAQERCRRETPPEEAVDGRTVRCFYPRREEV